METATRFVLLMHPKEYRHQKCTTGRIACLNLARGEIIQGIDFDGHPRVRALADDPRNFPVLLYPGSDTVRAGSVVSAARLGGRQLVVFLVDATWHCSRTIIRRSPSLLRLPGLALAPRAPSRYTIKRQPAPWCVSTLEAVHELLLDLEEAGLDTYEDKERLLSAFARMQDFQVLQTARAAARSPHHVRGQREPLPIND